MITFENTTVMNMKKRHAGSKKSDEQLGPF